ncbi:phosphopantetheine-binding protein [Nonomuraea basaltis]|uniref:phosphopantetheine-binding protein n=1 Tax=Nonomuraea basaltis TaxID=2495887 RepID=UPI00110C5923|nr:phosphopantetheine-binding protein [Nonomuraea basaltis]TMR99681.1 hypothetical protein EJK15_06445 [Nonomuraea basaltis]
MSHSGTPVDPIETLTALRDVPEVCGAVVTEHVAADGRTALLGYVTGPDPALGTVRIRQYLTSLLPDYLIPEHLFVLEEFPLTPAGDYDLSALPEPPAESGPVNGYVAPRTPVEHRLADIIKELLRIDTVGIHDNYFALGGSSILATRLAAQIHEIFAVEVPLLEVLASPTVDELAQLIDQPTPSSRDVIAEAARR